MTAQSRLICVVDDDIAILEVVKLVLEDEGYVVITNTGQQVVQMVEYYQPDMLLLDVWMQGLDGRDISRQLKQALSEEKELPIVLMSAHSDISQSVREAQADSFLEKPFGMDELIEKVEEVLGE